MTAISSASFYITGGTVQRDSACYVPRHADTDLLEGLRHGEFCYVHNAADGPVLAHGPHGHKAAAGGRLRLTFRLRGPTKDSHECYNRPGSVSELDCQNAHFPRIAYSETCPDCVVRFCSPKGDPN